MQTMPNNASPAALECAAEVSAAIHRGCHWGESAAIIDARVRPLVEALEEFVNGMEADEANHGLWMCQKEQLEKARAALSKWRSV